MKVLVVVDMQNDFISGSLGTEEAKAIVPNVVEKIKDYTFNDNLVLFTKDTHYDDYLETQEGKNLPIKHCIQDTWGWKIEPSVRNAWKENHKVVADTYNLRNTFYKTTFGSVELAEYIKKNFEYIDEIEFCGLVTEICVISNIVLVKAYCPGIKIRVDAKCCAGATPKRHREALSVMESIQVDVYNQGEINENL